jgi:hypothetical protein
LTAAPLRWDRNATDTAQDATMTDPASGLARTAQILRFLLKYRRAGVFTGLDLDAATLAFR